MPRRARLFLTPLLINLAFAIPLRLLLPVILENSGERYRYYQMSAVFPLPYCPSFHCFRILPPLIASLLPLETTDAFIVVGFIFEVLAGVMLWHLARRIQNSNRIALLTVAWFWATWAPIQSFSDPLLITDPVQAFWSLATLNLLLNFHFAPALLMLIVGAGVKESVLLVPVIYSVYVLLSRTQIRHKLSVLAVLVGIPAIVWLFLRLYLSSRFGYVISEDESYFRSTYFFWLWLPNLGFWPRNALIAALYIFGAFGAAWILAPLGFSRSTREQRALTLATIPCMLFLALYQVPDRGLASFPYAVLIPAAVITAAMPAPLAWMMVMTNAAFTIRMNTAAWWLPPIPVLLSILLLLVTASAYFFWHGRLKMDGADEWSADTPPHDHAASHPGPFSRRRLLAGTAALVVLVGSFLAWRVTVPSRVTRLALPGLPETAIVDDLHGTPGLAISPNGRQVVFVGRATSGGRQQLRLRRIEQDTAEVLGGTMGASAPFWSFDGCCIGFFADGKLKTLELATRAVTTLADAPHPRGGSWGRRDVIVFVPETVGAPSRISARGGVTTAAIGLAELGVEAARWPSFLPDGERFLFVASSPNAEASGLYLGSLETGRATRIMPNVDGAAYVQPGFLFFARGNSLWVEQFDLRRLGLFGLPMLIAPRIATAPDSRRAAFSATSNAVIFAIDPAESAQQRPLSELKWVNRDGRILGTSGLTDSLDGVELSPDEQQALTEHVSMGDAWTWDVSRNRAIPLSASRTAHRGSIWTADGMRTVFAASKTLAGFQQWDMREQSSQSDAESVLLSGMPTAPRPLSWSPDARRLLYQSPGNKSWILWELVRGSQPTLLFPGQSSQAQAQFSPDGKWIAYSSEETGVREIFVQPYPPTGAKWQISTDGGAQPRWRRDGRELLYIVDDRVVMAVAVEADDTFHAGQPDRVLETRMMPARFTQLGFQYAVSADAQRFLINTAAGPEPSAPVVVVMNWRGALSTP